MKPIVLAMIWQSRSAGGEADLGYGYLKEKGLLDPYLDASGWAYDIPFDQLAEIQDFFMVSPSAAQTMQVGSTVIPRITQRMTALPFRWRKAG